MLDEDGVNDPGDGLSIHTHSSWTAFALPYRQRNVQELSGLMYLFSAGTRTPYL